MTIFSGRQLRRLNRDVDGEALYKREKDGRELQYVSAWYAICEANRIFGHGGWDRETLSLEKIFERTRFDVTSCAYTARVRITVHGPTGKVSREGTGFGQASQAQASDAHEKALKSAETDATKRALATFGPRFGLLLYRPRPPNRAAAPAAPKPAFCLVAPDGKILSESLSVEGFLNGFRQLVDKVDSQEDLTRLVNVNAISCRRLADAQPPGGEKGHVVRVDALVAQRSAAFQRASTNPTRPKALPPEMTAEASTDEKLPAPLPLSVPSPSRSDLRVRVDKSVLSYATNRRIRNKAHLEMVASKPCLVCEETGSHAHHVTYAQPRGLAVKVSDEFTVPLCALHHNQLHRSGSEKSWWGLHGIDPLQQAEALWMETLRKLLSQETTIS